MADHSHGASASAATSHDATSHMTHHDTTTNFHHNTSHHNHSSHHHSHSSETQPLKHHHGHKHPRPHHPHHQPQDPYDPPPYGTIPSDPENQVVRSYHHAQARLQYRNSCPECAKSANSSSDPWIIILKLILFAFFAAFGYNIYSEVTTRRPGGPW